MVYSAISEAQFYTIIRELPKKEKKEEKKEDPAPERIINKIDTVIVRDTIRVLDTLPDPELLWQLMMLKKRYRNKPQPEPMTPPLVQIPRGYIPPNQDGLPELTLMNVYDEILRNQLAHPLIVLMQAILETGWFTSSVCHTKHNLFGLTNPRTAQYYEFNHWTESVRAYYTKVQYRYKGGDYLKWLKDIGYAEDPGYIEKLKILLKKFS